jgi:hypothetical protein
MPYRARIFKRLWSPGIDSKEWIPPACSLASRYNNPIPPRFLAPIDSLKISALHVRQYAVVLSTKRQKRPFHKVITRLKLLCSNNYCIIFKGLVARSHSLLVFLFYIHSYTTHSLITFVEFHSSFLIDVRLVRGPGMPSRDSNSGPPYSSPTRNQLSHAHPNWAMPHLNWATSRPKKLSHAAS